MKKSVIVVVCLLLVGIFGWSIAKANSADIKVHLGAGTIVMDQQELVLTPAPASADGKNGLPGILGCRYAKYFNGKR